MSSIRRKIKRKKQKKLSLSEMNNMLMSESDKIKTTIEELKKKYGFELDYAFKPLTMEEIKNFKE